jgi:hypothetical protein
VKAIVEQFGKIDVLINNAGDSQGITADMSLEQAEEIWDRELDTNLKGPFLMALAVLPHLARPGGRIINISSDGALTGGGALPGFAGSRFHHGRVTERERRPAVWMRPAARFPSRSNRLLRLVVALEVPLYFGAAVLHLGVSSRLGSLVLAVPNTILPATIIETMPGLAVATNLLALIRGRARRAVTLGVHLFALVGVVLGMVALAMRFGPPPGPDWTLHYVMLAGIAAVLVLVLRRANQ